ncbi:hypothetical protein [Emcibacter sp.]|uniref:hypothetical protein n=1 Tax=Emcibacter sp. TaxID=1979954 RepID=UPI002AA72D71|nr:hypothetical protein [Emcibacter sp.]
MRITDPCDICGIEAETIPSTGDEVHQICPACGEFRLSGTASSLVSKEYRTKKYMLRGWIRDQLREGSLPLIDSHTLKAIVTRKKPSIKERADKLLLEIYHYKPELGADIHVDDPSLIAATYSKDFNEFIFLEQYLESKKYLGGDVIGTFEVLPEGYIYIEEKLLRPFSNSPKGFVAMWFDASMDTVYEKGFQAAVLDVGYDPIRVDLIEHNNKIDDEIIANINSSKFVVADFTGHRGGVYFEAGYALGKGIPVFWSCRKDDIKNLHFDIRQYNCVVWESSQELREKLAKRIEAVLSFGPHKEGNSIP